MTDKLNKTVRAGRSRRAGGFAMVLVMILVAAGVILGISYLTVASLHVQISQNYQSLSRARYLAESGLEHALYIVRLSPEGLDGSLAAPLGPFYVDATSDSYIISGWEDPEGSGQYTLRSTAMIGDIRRTSSMTVYRTAGATTKMDHGILVGGGFTLLPWYLTINGDIHTNGNVLNYAAINGDASSTQNISDPFGRISGSIDTDVEEVEVPEIEPDQYINYNLGGTGYEAIEFTGLNFRSNNPLAGGGAVTPNNIGGVVYLNPTSGNTVTLMNNLNFTGTLVINGNLKLGGRNITLTAVEGFPAIVVTGSVKITKNAKNVTINGVVAANKGFKRSGNTRRSSTTLNGALISNQGGYASNLRGSHTLNYQEDLAELYDFSQGPGGAAPQVTVLAWND